jgi:hypothetical protein
MHIRFLAPAVAPAGQVLRLTQQQAYANPFVSWLSAFGYTCAQWMGSSDQEKRLLVATRRFNNYGLFLSRDQKVASFVAQVDAACKASGPQNLSVPLAVAPYPNTGLSVPPAVAPAGQTVVASPAPAPSTVLTNSQGQLVDQNGNVLTDQNGNAIKYAGPSRPVRIAVNLLIAALIVGIPAYAASYYGAKRAAKK